MFYNFRCFILNNAVLKYFALVGLITITLLSACQTTKTIQPPSHSPEVTESKKDIPKFRKVTIDTVFRSESITAVDLNNDDLPDLVIGDVWYQAPNWIMHEIRTPGVFDNGIHKWGEESGPNPYYSNSFAVQSIDVNKDGWQDVITYPVMNEPVYWYENPKGLSNHWTEHIAYKAYHGESPLLMNTVDGDAYPLAGFNVSDTLMHLGVIAPSKNDYNQWDLFTIGHTAVKQFKGPGWNKLSKLFAPGAIDHGLGIGDINGDDKDDVLTKSGWYEAPENAWEENWDFHYIPFDSIANPETPQYQFAQMEIFDIDKDGDADFFASSAHQYGLWWFEQIQKNGEIRFEKHTLPKKISQAHAVAKGDLNNNGIPDLVTGKRYLAHTGNDPGWDEPIELLWLEPKVTSKGLVEWEIHIIDVGVGVGTQIELSDINSDGKVDILTSNKKGTYIFLQE